MGNPALVDPATVRRTAAEGWIWGFSLLENYRTMYPQAIDEADPRYVGGFGVFRHYPKPFTPANTDVVTPNNDTPYSWAWLDLRAEPWVIEVPAMNRYYVIPVHELDTPYVGFVGSRTTGQEAGRYLVTGPRHHDVPADGFDGVLRADTELVGILGRTYLAARRTYPSWSGSRAGTGCCRSARTGAPSRRRPRTSRSGRSGGRRSGTPWSSSSCWTSCSASSRPGHGSAFPAEQDLRRRLAELGIGVGDFEPATLTAELRESIAQGIADGRAELERAAAGTVGSTGLFGTRAELGEDFLARAVGAHMGLYGLPSAEAWYGGWAADSEGNRPPDASERDYVLRFPPGKLPPARFFWSATMYRLPERLLVDNPLQRYSIGDRTPGLVYDPDGGLTLHVRHKRPADADHNANWLPAPDGPFTVVIRLYGPDQAVLDGSWTLPVLALRGPEEEDQA
ncbi:DUF1254 domain-containing protein [Kitasatospora gansuensis]